MSTSEHLDVLIVGAGLSGIGAACHLKEKCPRKSFAILEAREATGGTWDLFRYPGIRSDSDMFTLGYSFQPWEQAEAIADGPAILDYVRDTAREHGVDRDVRFGKRVVRAEWSGEETRWTVDAEGPDGETTQLTCGFLFLCTGYYSYEGSYMPEFEGTERFAGPIVDPQHWPEDIDYDGKRVVVIGSGATAATIVPAMAERAEHVTMLQRSPSYMVALPARDPVAAFLQRKLSKKRAYALLRWKNVLFTQVTFALSRRLPGFVRKVITKEAEKALPAGYADPHFTPRYDPWDQRICLVPDGDLFRAIRKGTVSIATDRIAGFTETGLALESGAELDADIVVTATGLNLLAAGGMEIVVDGDPVEMPKTVGYKGIMYSGIPNFAITLGYTNASWTLKADLTCEYVCRVLNHMYAHGYSQVTPRWPEPTLPDIPFIDLKSGYVLRSIDQFPRQGEHAPWRLHQNYPRDIRLLRHGPVEDEGLEFVRAGTPAPVPA
ncbi:MAG: NAD(P)/FAD-dependent oxidoreductase [Thermoleophilaceae bacterium]|nr:NAD(P)/FAD-dependent oxidoreductase [Thermoleophilaceae bacterium]